MKRLVPLLGSTVEDRGKFLEPFVGGGSVALTIAAEYPNTRIHINDLDLNIFTFWDLVVNGEASEIGVMFSLLEEGATLEIFDRNRQRCNIEDLTRAERAYLAIFFSKTTHNGMFLNGPIGGRTQEGKKWRVDCQFKPVNMTRTFKKIRVLLKGKTEVTNLTAIDFLDAFPEDTPAYLDPPYYVAGKKCYPVFMTTKEHTSLADTLQRRSNWLMSYDDCEEIRSLYEWAEVEDFQFRYSMSSHGSGRSWKNKTELLISDKLFLPQEDLMQPETKTAPAPAKPSKLAEINEKLAAERRRLLLEAVLEKTNDFSIKDLEEFIS